MPREKPLTVATELSGRYDYRVKRLVGGGGMAWVYQVERLDGNSTSLWALKELRPQTEDSDTQAHARTLFDQEATILSQLDHPNLPQVIDFFEDAGRAYLVMEFIWGESLEKRLEQTRSPLMERQVLQWSVQVCEVLGYLHSRQPPVIFRDLKPSNIMVNNAGVVKLVDFGIARTYKEDKLQDTIALGSENYAAPEQWGQAQTDPRSDIYGLGSTMYHLLAAMPPSPAFLPSEPTPLDQLNGAVSAETVRIVTKAMMRDREARYQSAKEMEAELLACLPGYVSPLQPKTDTRQTTTATTPPRLRQPAQPQTQPSSAAGKQAAPAAAGKQAAPTAAGKQAAPTAAGKQAAPAAAGKQAAPTAAGNQAAPAAAGKQAAPTAAGKQAAPTAARQEATLASGGATQAAPSAPTATQVRPKPVVRRRVRRVKVCPRCKHRNELASRFCVRCGYAFVGVRPAVLRVIEPVRAAWEMPIARSPMLFGRARPEEGYRPDFDMSFYDPEGYVSRRHGEIVKARNGYFITDLGSSNGTYVNDRALPAHKPRLLRNGDEIAIGEVVLQFLLR